MSCVPKKPDVWAVNISTSFIIPWVWVLFGVITSTIVGLMSGYIPAHKASRLDPIDSLRFE